LDKELYPCTDHLEKCI